MNTSNADPYGTEAGVAALPPTATASCAIPDGDDSVAPLVTNRAPDGTGRVSAAAMTDRRPTRLRALVSELRAAWRDPATPPPVPRIVDYPVRRRP
jgi:hypothetical protein